MVVRYKECYDIDIAIAEGIYYPPQGGRSEAGLSRRPVKPEIAGSIPVAPVYGKGRKSLFWSHEKYWLSSINPKMLIS